MFPTLSHSDSTKTNDCKRFALRLRPESGRATVLGADTAAPDFPAVREDIGVVLDEGCFPETLTAPQVGRIMAATYRRWEQDTFDAYCKRFGLPEKTAFKDYSRGMKMKLTIAAALSHQARLLVLDEATAGLDPIVRDEVLEIFKISKVGTVAGCVVREGKLQRSTPIRVIRDGIVIYTGKLGSLKRFKDDVKEVTTGQDCGLNIESFNDIRVGDIVEGYEQVEVKRN